jgi:uncharacterized protein YbaA (DUF1428 family)
MSYVDGFVTPVPNANRDAFRQHAEQAWAILEALGATAHWECWGDDVPPGQHTSLPVAVQLADDETVVFSWVQWPDKETRDHAWQRMQTEPELGASMPEAPYDGKRMIYGGFTPLVAHGVMAGA